MSNDSDSDLKCILLWPQMKEQNIVLKYYLKYILDQFRFGPFTKTSCMPKNGMQKIVKILEQLLPLWFKLLSNTNSIPS